MDLNELMETIKSIVSNNDDEYLKSEECAKSLDEKDPLNCFRDEFLYPPKNPKDPSSGQSIYLCGNSLGLQPKALKKRIQEELDDWANLGVEAHFDGRHPWVSTDEPLLENVYSISC